MTGPNVRIADPLKAEAAAYARTIGISLNALVAVAVRDYLDARRPAVTAPAAAAVAAPAKLAPLPAGTRKPGRNDPCPCGSGKKFKQCHGGAS